MENQELDIKNLQFTSEDTGSFFSKTYTEYNWKFILDGVHRSITLNHSKILGRRTIFLGNQEICRYQKYTYNFHYSFPIEVHTISITQSDDSYILKIDEIPFNRLLNEQKLRRFNIIKETFLEKERERKDKKKKEREIRKFRTFNRGSAGIPISRRTDDQRNKYNTSIYSSNRYNEENLNIDNENSINTSSNRNDIINSNINNEEKKKENEIILNQEQYDYYYEDEMSEDLSNKAIDGGDSDRDEDEDENGNEDNDEDKTIQESFRPPEDDDFYNDEYEEEREDDEKNINNINNIEDKREEEEEDDIKEKEKKNNNIANYNNINNELQPIKSNKKESHLKKIKIKSKKNKFFENKVKENEKNNNDNIINEKNNIDNENNINNENNHFDLLGEEIYNSSRDKDLYNNNVNNNLNINYLISQKEKNFNDYKSNNPSNPFEDDSINTK
jgi:hypothetical protein